MCLYFMEWLNWANYHIHHLALFASKPVGGFEICLYQQQLPCCAPYLTQLNMDLWLMPWPPTSGNTLQHTVPLVLIFLDYFCRDSMLYWSFGGWLKPLLPNLSGSSQLLANVTISSVSEMPVIVLRCGYLRNPLFFLTPWWPLNVEWGDQTTIVSWGRQWMSQLMVSPGILV